jgi:hypothetical protein
LTRLRIGFALAGFLLALLSVAYDDRRLAWGAIALLAGSLLVRLWMERRDGPADRGPL